MSKEATLTSETTGLLNYMTPRMLDKGFEMFNEELNNAMFKVFSEYFSPDELKSFKLTDQNVIELKRYEDEDEDNED